MNFASPRSERVIFSWKYKSSMSAATKRIKVSENPRKELLKISRFPKKNNWMERNIEEKFSLISREKIFVLLIGETHGPTSLL